MSEPLRLVAFRPSIYCWSVRLAMAELDLTFDWVETNPFNGVVADHPFNRVPVLWVSDRRIYETGAILDWLYPPLADPLARAEARQAAGIADAYAYWPMVRQVYAKGVLAAEDADAVDNGMAAAVPVLAALEEIAEGGRVLNQATGGLTAVDCHIAPMIGAFAAFDAGRTHLHRHAALREWYESVTQRPNWAATCPDPRILSP
ncbi:MAG: glutathione S-transferase family protein [Pseudomonadota bacterium]